MFGSDLCSAQAPTVGAFLIQIKSTSGWSTIVAAQNNDVTSMTKGKVAIVTGSTSGIGLGIARALAGAGCDIMLNGFGDAAEIRGAARPLDGGWAAHKPRGRPQP